MNDIPKILLLTAVRPGAKGVGELFLGTLSGCYPRGRVCCLEVATRKVAKDDRPLGWLPTHRLRSPRYSGVSRLGKRFFLASSLATRWWYRCAGLSGVLRAALDFGRKERVDLVWAPLHWPATLQLAAPLADGLDVPLITTVWDPPKYVLERCSSLVPAVARDMLQAFDRAMRASERCSVASDAMKNAYETEYRVPCIPMTFSPQRNGARASKALRASRGPIVIACAGTIYALDEWKATIRALSARKWRLRGRNVVLRILTQDVSSLGPLPSQVQHLGWKGLPEVLRTLASADIGYLPYWFAPAYREAALLSFPSKMATYVAAGLPTFFHGPQNSSPVMFLRRYHVGRSCSSLEPEVIGDCLERMACDVRFLEQARMECAKAYEEELSWPVFRRRFAALIGVPVTALSTNLAI